MPTIIQIFYEEITNDLRKLKTNKDEYQIIINFSFKMIQCLSHDVYKNY